MIDLLFLLAMLAIGLAVLYLVVRAAVCGGILDADLKREARARQVAAAASSNRDADGAGLDRILPLDRPD